MSVSSSDAGSGSDNKVVLWASKYRSPRTGFLVKASDWNDITECIYKLYQILKLIP